MALAQAAPTKPQPKPLPPQIDLSPAFEHWNLPIKYQNMRDTCAVFTVTGGIEFALSKTMNEGVNLSEEYLNWAANEVAGDNNDGASFAQLQQGFNKWGQSEQTEMPYRPSYNASNAPTQKALGNAHQIWALKPKWNWLAAERTQGLTATDIASAKRILSRGYPVCAEGEHCMLIVGYNDEWEDGTFLVRDYAKRSYETLSYADAARRFESLLWVQFPSPPTN
jgi:C1A family cysteine protease